MHSIAQTIALRFVKYLQQLANRNLFEQKHIHKELQRGYVSIVKLNDWVEIGRSTHSDTNTRIFS